MSAVGAFISFLTLLSIACAVLPIRSIQTLADERCAIALKADIQHLTVVRVVDTAQHAAIRQYVVQHFKALRWQVEEDVFQAKTPLGVRTFTNIVCTFNPLNHTKRLLLAAHYDSKYFPEPNKFVAATDSAVPCAMLMSIARSLQPHLERAAASADIATRMQMGLQMVFFDGEEAFHEWTEHDSLYGSRHLAAQWSNVSHAHTLRGIALLVLLDLIGAPNPHFYDLYTSSTKQYNALAALEKRMRTAKMLADAKIPFFDVTRRVDSTVEDDHVPFLKRGVSVLHIIALPFPIAWHTPGDNLASLDWVSTNELTLLFICWTAQYLHLSIR